MTRLDFRLRSNTIREGAAALIILALLAALFWRALGWLAHAWFTDEYYAHGPLVPLVSAALLWRLRLRRFVRPEAGPRAFAAGAVLVACGVAAHVVAAAQHAHYLSVLALIAVLMGVVLALRGLDALRAAAFPLALLVAAVPLPIVDRLSQPLQSWTASWAASLARAVGLPVTQTGAQLALPACSFVVGAPCSGLRSIIAFLTLTALLLYLTRGSWSSRLALAALGVPVALAGNVLRVLSLLAVAQLWGADAAMRYYHTAFGFVFYVLAMGLLLALAGVLGCDQPRSDI